MASSGREVIPPIFVSHGRTASALDAESAKEFERWGRELPRPRGVLVIGAHWQTTTLSRGSTAARPPLIHDLDHDGPPPADARKRLESFAYAAPGAPALAYDLSLLVPVTPAERGWDSSVWSPLARMFPAADIPVLQMSLVAGTSARSLFALGKRIGVLAAQGYLIVGSGGVTRNAGEAQPARDAEPPAWARGFDTWVSNLLADAEVEELFSWRSKAPEALRAHPTSEHLDPLFVVAGAASLYENAVGFPIRGFEHATMSRRCVQFGR